MSRYYFFVATLPTLRYEDRDAQDPSDFLEVAGDHLDKDDAELLPLARIDAPDAGGSEPEPVRSWVDFERDLRNALAKVRAQRAGKEVSGFLRENGAGETNMAAYEELAREAVAAESPLTGEDLINRARFAFAEELEVNHFFDIDVIVAHYIKLQVIARRKTFSRSEGEKRFAAISDQITSEYYQETKV